MAQTEPIKVGVLYSETGVTSAIETSQLYATLFAIREINDAGGIDGREVVPIRYDPQSDPVKYRLLAERLILEDDVPVIFGCYMSSTRKAVLPIVERWNRLLFYATLYEGFEFSENLVYTGAAPNQNSVQLANFMTSHFGPRVYMVGSNYIYPYESNRIMSDLVMQRPGGAKLGERYVRLGATEDDFADIIEEIGKTRPDFIFSTVVGSATQHFYRAYARAGFDPATMPIASLTTSEVEVGQMGAEIACGHITAAPYFRSIGSETNHACVEKFARAFGADVMPNASWEAAYFQVHLMARAMCAAGSADIEALMPRLLGSEFDAPQGRVRVDASTHHTWLYPRIGRVNGRGEFVIEQEAGTAVGPDPYLVDHALGDWSAK
ncbi:transporter substrate-binding domain-containing protein [Paraburkholderia rhynchosiae]|uniref:Aliphatic amidase expression-regulating protein n=1 Tax=Paraburkholderia rhynchosiae TaxID=487049 RepID=A0A2N7W074_9BURK|nr:transporter substrate-binding domain-containing protein [Paraburkholderia rhynchosiae]PMS22773.1 amino acid ABC transporter substrate-binding protein [Paraburkholderia rhynchosiae]CAB3740991.1 Aliphatic amidase expression-regulating protein [Paraburkholderia rhynchosiae]